MSRAAFPLTSLRKAAWILCLTALAVAAMASPAAAADAPPEDLGFRSVVQDQADMASSCPAASPAKNLVVVITVRGSGELPLLGKLPKAYYPHLAGELVKRGYRVSGFEVAYPAMRTDALVGRVPEYLSSAIGSGPKVAAQLNALAVRCPTRRIIIAGYSQGAIALRAAINRLAASPSTVWKRFEQIDLFGDGSASTVADRGMPTGTTSLVKVPARRGSMGIVLYGRNATADTRSAAAQTFAKIFRADNLKAIAALEAPKPYPAALRPRVDRYCMLEDIICDTKRVAAGFEDRARDVGCFRGPIGIAACGTEHGFMKAYLKYTLGQHSLYRWKAAALQTALTFAPHAPAVVASAPFMTQPFTDVGQSSAELVRQPPLIYFSGAGACNPFFSDLTWSEWGPTRAVGNGSGSFVIDSSISCAEAIRASGLVTVTMSEPMRCGGRPDLVFTRMTWASEIESNTFSAAIYC